MFIKPPYHGPSQNGFTNDFSRLRAEWLNYVGGNFASALDAIGGGYYQFTGDIRLSSSTAQFKINAPAISDPIELRGFVTIGLSDDINYPTGTGTLTVAIPATFTAAATFSAGVTYSGAIVYSNTVQFNGAVTVNAATTFTSNGDVTLQSGCAVTGASGSSLTMDSGSTTTINGSATLAGTNTLSGTTTISGATTLSGATTAISGTTTISGTTAINANVTLGTGVDISVSPTRTFTRVCKPLTTTTSATWAASADPEIFPFEISQISTTTDTFSYLADVPDGATITSIIVTVDPPAAHGGEPASKPKIYLYKFDVLTRTKTLVTTYTDVAVLPDYENSRLIQTATVSTTRDATSDVFTVLLEGESGANSLNGLQFAAPIVEFTRGKIGEE
jgi:hypothetical protein